MNEKSSCPVLRGRDSGNTVLLLDDLSGATLNWADLSEADLEDANNFTTEQLDKAKSLQSATMPDGSKHL
jgi:uncharacterized protein YjbI with pentapeptide repeats